MLRALSGVDPRCWARPSSEPATLRYASRDSRPTRAPARHANREVAADVALDDEWNGHSSRVCYANLVMPMRLGVGITTLALRFWAEMGFVVSGNAQFRGGLRNGPKAESAGPPPSNLITATA